MEENAKAELQLSEEKLQQITGGCKACEKEIGEIGSRQNTINSYNKIITNAQNKGKHAIAEKYMDLRDDHRNVIQNLKDSINDRQRWIPGHVLPEGYTP